MILAPWPVTQVVTYPMIEASLQEASDEEVAAYHERLRDILRSSDELTGEALERTRDLVNELQDRVLGQMERVRAADRFRAFWLPWMQHAVSQVSADFASRYGHEIEGFLPRAWELGHRTVDATMALPDAMPVLTMTQVGISAQLHPELITGLDEETRRIIGREIAIAVNMGDSTHNVMQRLVLPLENQQSPFRKVAYRAEVVARTEMARHADLAAAARMEQSQQLYPEREQWWTILVAEVNGWPCKHCSAIAADGPWRVGDPRGPLLPLHPNCRCVRVGYRPRVEDVDVPTTAEREASVTDSQAPDEGESRSSEQLTSNSTSTSEESIDRERSAVTPNEPQTTTGGRERKFFPEVPSSTEQMAASIPVPAAQVDRVVAHIEELRKQGLANDEYGAGDVHLVAAYLLNPANAEEDAWERILAGGPAAYGILKHEGVELLYQLQAGINPMDEKERFSQRAVVRKAHAEGLLAEHTYLLRIAQDDQEFKGVTLGDLIMMNPAGDDEDDFTDVRKKTSAYPTTTSHGRGLAKSFFAKILRRGRIEP